MPEMSSDDLKRAAAHASLNYVTDGMVLGLGTGSTARYFLEGLARKIADEGLDVSGVPTSLATAEAARLLRIPLTSLEERPILDLAVDGADEVDPRLDLIKGLGGALFREKIVASAAKKFIVVVDSSKLVPRLGTKAPVPVEVHPFGWKATQTRLEALGARVALRAKDGTPFRTDNGNHILDARFGEMRKPANVAAALDEIPGVVGHGLFLGMTDLVLAASPEGVRTLRPTRRI